LFLSFLTFALRATVFLACRS